MQRDGPGHRDDVHDGRRAGCAGVGVWYRNRTGRPEKGYAREALQAVMQTYFEKTNAEMFTGGHYAYNLASGKLLKAVGFQYEGVEHKAMRHATRGATDLVCYYIEKG